VQRDTNFVEVEQENICKCFYCFLSQMISNIYHIMDHSSGVITGFLTKKENT